MKTEETEQCIGCEKQFPDGTLSTSSGEPMCEECEASFHKEIKDSGIEKLDEYLEARGLKEDFNIFCQAKFSDLTEEEICEVNEHIDHDYERWNLQSLSSPQPSAGKEGITARECLDKMEFVLNELQNKYGWDWTTMPDEKRITRDLIRDTIIILSSQPLPLNKEKETKPEIEKGGMSS